MYIFAEPVTEEEVTEIQSHNDAKIQDFERKILGLHSDETDATESPQEDDSQWADIQASVQDAMDKDELGLDEAAESRSEDTDGLAEQPQGHRTIEEGRLPVRQSSPEHEDDSRASVADDVDDEVDEEEGNEDEDREDDDDDNGEEDEEDGEDGEDEENEENEENEEDEGDQEEDENEMEVKEDIGDEQEDDIVQETAGSSSRLSNIGTTGQSMEVPHEEPDPLADAWMTEKASSSEDTMQASEQALDDPIDASENADDQSSPSDLEVAVPSMDEKQKTTTGTREESMRPFEKAAGFNIQADGPFISEIDSASPPKSILAMTLTLRNKVNNAFVLRPENLTASDAWSIEYSVTEVPDESRAWALYEACQARRKKKLDAPMPAEDEEKVSYYIKNLRNLSEKGRKWRREQEQRDKEGHVQVLGKELEDARIGDKGHPADPEPAA